MMVASTLRRSTHNHLLSRRCRLPGSIASNYKGPPQGPMVGPWESYPDISTMKQLKHILATFPWIFRTFPTPKSLSNSLKHTNTPLNQLPRSHGRLWTFWFLNLLNDLYQLKMDLETTLRPYETYFRLYDTSWIFNVLHYPLPLRNIRPQMTPKLFLKEGIDSRLVAQQINNIKST